MMTQTRIGKWLKAPRLAARPTFAVGDIHGRDDLLVALLDVIKSIISQDRLEGVLVVFLGDYIDRGPHSLDALRRVLDLQPGPELEPCCLPGNHEQLLRGFLSSHSMTRSAIFKVWFRNGGSYFLRELGFRAEEVASFDLDLLATKIVQAVGRDRVDKLMGLPNHLRLGDYLFVHAGIHPATGLSTLTRDWAILPVSRDDEDADPLWVRGPFLTYEGEHEDRVVVIHGHTPRKVVELRENRIGIDTGAYATGRLSAIQLAGAMVRVIQATSRPQGFSWLCGLVNQKGLP